MSKQLKHIDILDFSDFLISYYRDMGTGVTPIKLQKLLYYVQAWHLVHFEHPLFKDIPQAWVNGPVYPKVYKKYKGTSRLEYIKSNDLEVSELMSEFGFNEKQQHIVFETLRIYGLKSSFELVYKTHSEQPWIDARKGTPPFASSNAQISHNTMKMYYKKKLEDAKKRK